MDFRRIRLNIRKLINFILLLSLCLSIWGCAPKREKARIKIEAVPVEEATFEGLVEESSEPFIQKARAEKVIAPGYLIHLSTLEDEKLNGDFRVAHDGALKLPYGVTLTAENKTLSALQAEVKKAYQTYFKVSPTMQLTIAEKKYSVRIEGLVQKPGEYYLKKESSFDEVIALAGGLQQGKNTETVAQYANIEQLGEAWDVKLAHYYAGNKNRIPDWQGGERIFFQSESHSDQVGIDRRFIHMLGQVKNPGEYTAENGADFYSYLAKAGGPDGDADFSRVEIIRIENGEKLSIVFDVEKGARLPVLRGGDVVMVHAKDADTLLTNVTGVIQSISTILLAAVAL